MPDSLLSREDHFAYASILLGYESACSAAAGDGRAAPPLEPFLVGRSEPVRAAVYNHFEPPKIRGYTLFEEVGRGGMGTVYRARAAAGGPDVAIKVLKGAESERTKRLLLTADNEVLMHLDHENLVPIEKCVECPAFMYQVMPYVRGGNLKTRLDEWCAGYAPLAPEERARRKRAIAVLVAQLARAAFYLHNCGIIHRDLKPANVLLDADNGDRPRVCDLGLARRVAETNDLTQPGEVAGSYPYMAPEQLAGGRALTRAADVYALGAVLYELLTGHPPFVERPDVGLEQLRARKCTERQPPHPAARNPALEPDGALEWIATECLHLDPGARFYDAKDLAKALEEYAKTGTVRGMPPPKRWWERVLERVKGDLREPDHIARWFQPLRIEACTCLLAHVGAFALLWNGAPGWALWCWVLLADTALGWAIWVTSFLRRGEKLTLLEWDTLHLWIATTTGEVFLFALFCPLFGPADPHAVVQFYAAWAVMRAVLFYVEGHLFWPRLRLLSTAYVVTALVAPRIDLWAALLHGCVTCAGFMWMSCQKYGNAAAKK